MATRNKNEKTAAPESKNEETAAPESNGLPARSGVTVAAEGSKSATPPRQGRPRADYSAWQSTIDELQANLGTAFNYEGVKNCDTLANGLRRQFGVKASAQRMDKETRVGTLWVEYPSIVQDDGSRIEDSDAVTNTLAKYAK